MISNIHGLIDNLMIDIPKIISKTSLKNEICKKLYDYQIPHVISLINILVNKSLAFDLTDTGVGKTYVTAAICKELDLQPLIICPKTLMFNWSQVLTYFNVKPFNIVNYETIRNGKMYIDDSLTRANSFYITISDNSKLYYEWKIPNNVIIIFDEAHHCKNPGSFNGKLLMSTKQLILTKKPVLLLSATLCEKVDDMKIPFFLLDLIKDISQFHKCFKLMKYRHNKIQFSSFKTEEERLKAKNDYKIAIIHQELKNNISKIKISELGDKFPQNQWFAQQFVADETKMIIKFYKKIKRYIEKYRESQSTHHLAKIQKLKQEIEIRKAPIFIEQADIYLKDNKSVIIFVNYLDTFHLIADKLAIKCKIYGDQNLAERQQAIDLFQSNQERIIICQIKSGGTGIGLHDTDGNFPRVVLLNYPDSASVLKQALGRAARIGSKSPVLQRIICVSNVPYEKNIMENINKKLKNIESLNDTELQI